MFEADEFDELHRWTGRWIAPVEQDVEDEPLLFGRTFASVPKLAPAKTPEALSFIRQEIVEKDDQWYRRCLSLQRQARGLPAVYPTALSAAQATPKSERVHRIEDLRKGMVGFSYDPSIPGTAGHVFSIHGWSKNGVLLTGTNDAEAPGRVSIVPFTYYQKYWNQKFQFGATWLNGYDFSDFNNPPEPVKQGTLGERYEDALEELRKIEVQKRAKGWDKLADAILRDIKRMEKKLEKFNGE